LLEVAETLCELAFPHHFGFPTNPLTFDSVKRLLTLSLLVLFLLNVLGYYGVFVGLQVKSGQAMRDQFDEENYSTEQEVTIKVPITIPYATDSRGYERVDGEFEQNGQIYRLVKQKLQSDTLFIVCIKDNQAEKINQALEDYVKTFTDKPFNTKQNVKAPIVSKDYISTSLCIETVAMGWDFTSSNQLTQPNFYGFDFNQYISQPPEA
jgi:hypothetical protein